MAFSARTYYPKVYRDFKALDASNYHETVRFFEKYEEQILRLPFELYFEILSAYCRALFDAGAYRKHILMCDVVVELVIENNIGLYQGADIFRDTLFCKAASLYNLQETAPSEHILRELLKMNAADEDALRFLQKCRRGYYSILFNHFRAVSIFLFLLTAAIIAAEVLLVIPFYSAHASSVSLLRTGTFALGVSAMAAGHSYIHYLAHRDVRTFLASLPPKASFPTSSDA